MKYIHSLFFNENKNHNFMIYNLYEKSKMA